ncbi:hypothetical protein FA13DRAFT_1739684 [Coprinellus micaceus]|uniref:Uncharacterized protein n=1 Tax=Coprinellus micaceus TaxID=71717 RepID=A0A4Y7SQH5_COPMI|nr:hypothetical protein FA13DRAFT_1739684 [Coprinellus micaceus]
MIDGKVLGSAILGGVLAIVLAFILIRWAIVSRVSARVDKTEKAPSAPEPSPAVELQQISTGRGALNGGDHGTSKLKVEGGREPAALAGSRASGSKDPTGTSTLNWSAVYL